jgi:hypothetical protein
VSDRTAIALALAIASTTLTNIAYLREHDAAAALPALSMRRPLHSLGIVLGDRTWLLGFAMETGGFALYQRGGALTVAGLATLVTNALPIAAGTIVLHEPVPSGALGGLRILAFAAVTAGAILLATPGPRAERT